MSSQTTILAYKISEVTAKLSESLARVARQQSAVNRVFVETLAEHDIHMKGTLDAKEGPKENSGDKPG